MKILEQLVFSISESFLKDPSFFGTGEFSRSSENTRSFGSNDMMAVTIDTYESGVMGFASMMSPEARGIISLCAYIVPLYIFIF